MQFLRGGLRRTIGRALVGVVLGAALSPSLWAQDLSLDPGTPGDAPGNPPAEAPPFYGGTLEIWTAGAHNAPLKTRYGLKRDRELFITGVRFSRRFAIRKHGVWEYTNDILPIVVATQTPFYRDTAFTRILRVRGRNGEEFVTQKIDSLILYHRTVYGFGWAPLGIRYRTGNKHAQVVMGISAGALYFNRKMPDPGETQFNFTLDGIVALDIPLGARHGASIGYQFNHISNANTGRANPGMNSSMLRLGWVMKR